MTLACSAVVARMVAPAASCERARRAARFLSQNPRPIIGRRLRRSRARVRALERDAECDENATVGVPVGDLVDASAKFAYAWVIFGYVVPSALASVGVGEVASSADIAGERAVTLSVIMLACESAKAVATVRVLDGIDRGVAHYSFAPASVGVATEGLRYGVIASVAARIVDAAYASFFNYQVATTVDSSSLMTSAEDPLATACSVAASCAAAPFLEELFFRGFLCEDIRARTRSNVLAIALSSVIFAAAHFSPRDFASLATCGALFALARQSPGGVRASILAHATYNASVLIEQSLV